MAKKQSQVSTLSFDPDAAAESGSGVFGLPHTEKDAAVVLVPVPFDATTSYRRGAAAGPQAIFEASYQVDLFDIEVGHPYKRGIYMLPENKKVKTANNEARRAADAARQQHQKSRSKELTLVDRACGTVNTWLKHETLRLLDLQKIVGVVGGDHSTPFGFIEAIVERYPDVAILHIDAHADLRPHYEDFTWSHASIMRNVLEKTALKKLVQVGIRDFSFGEHTFIQQQSGRIKTFFDRELKREQARGTSWKTQIDRIMHELPHNVYISFDIDGLHPALCPNTGTPVPGGLSFDDVCTLFYELAQAKRRIVGFDLNEVAPGKNDEWDGNVGARLLYKMCGYALITNAHT